jgi:excisionase family DNA binding protein
MRLKLSSNPNLKLTPALQISSSSNLDITLDGEVLDLGEAFNAALLRIAQEVIAGNEITVTSETALLTSQQAAEFIGVSRPTLIKLLEEFQTPIKSTGSQRRIRFSDLLVLENQLRDKREVAFKQLIEISEKAGLHELTKDGFNPLLKS